MSVYADLAQLDGVIAAGEYSWRGDRYNFKGQLSEDMLCTNIDSKDCPFSEAHGWIVRGPQFSVCVMANVFCFVMNNPGVLNTVFARMRKKLMDAEELV